MRLLSDQIGPHKLDALRAIDNFQRTGEFADAWLIRHGYPEKQADSLLERIMDGRLAECGVSNRTGWLEPEGRRLLEAAKL